MSSRRRASSRLVAVVGVVFAAAACGGAARGDKVQVTADRIGPPPPPPPPPSTTLPDPPTPAADVRGGARRVVVQGMDLTGVGHDRGSVTAPVVVVEFSDFGCPYCGAFARETYPALDQEFVQTGQVFFKYVPFVIGMFPHGDLAARASECAADQHDFWPMYEQLYAVQTDWKRSGDPASLFRQYAASAKLDGARFATCYAGAEVGQRVALSNAFASRLRIRATPTFFVDGRMLEGALPLQQFRQLLSGMVQTGR